MRIAIRLFAVAGVLCLGATAAFGQSSTNFQMLPANVGYGGSIGSTNFKMVGQHFYGTTNRVSSPNRDIVPWLIGGAFDPQATVTIASAAGSYAGVTFPLTMASPLATTVLGALGSPDNTKWRLGHWSPTDSAYAEVGGTIPITNLARGQGYWLITKDAANIATIGLPARADQYTLIALASGPGGRPAWNMLGNPYTYPIPLGLMFVDDGVIIKNVNDATNTLTEHTIKTWSGSNYADATVVNGRQAFWLRKLVSQAVTLYIPPTASATGSPEPARLKPADANWAVAINGLQGERITETVWLGSAPVADRGWNAMAVSRGPMPPMGEPLSLFVRRHDWREMNGDYVRVFEPSADRMGWDLTLSGTEGPGEVTLAIQGFDLPAGLRLFLTDPVEGWTRQVTPGQAVRVAAGTAAKSLRFEAALGSVAVETTPLVDGLRGVYPNPFRGDAGIRFTLAQPASIHVDIFDLQGRLVRRLDRSRAGSGDQVLVWDGRDEGGLTVGSGVFLARWRAGEAQGSTRLVRVD